MKPKPNQRIDKLLGELGLHPHPSKVARYHRERHQRDAKEKPKLRLPGVPWHPAFSPLCHAACGEAALPLLLANPGTSPPQKNLGSSKSSGTTRNAGRNRRNHHPSPPSDES